MSETTESHPLSGSYRWSDPGNPPANSTIVIECHPNGTLSGQYWIADIINGVIQEPYSIDIAGGVWRKLDKGIGDVETFQLGFLVPTTGTQPGNELTIDAWAGWGARFEKQDPNIPLIHVQVTYASDQGGTDPSHPNKVVWLGASEPRMYTRVS